MACNQVIMMTCIILSILLQCSAPRILSRSPNHIQGQCMMQLRSQSKIDRDTPLIPSHFLSVDLQDSWKRDP
ncbi:hypothetical protein BD769DRAFT_1547163 [Suillus cothurnatus]|nr:hypothetical protein BD769DRAFT_1547163 [Suillus cothurnatus]